MIGLRNILLFVFGSLYLLSSAGIIIFKTHCCCTDSKKVSLYVTPETCDSESHQKYTHLTMCEIGNDEKNQCDACTTHTHDCGCDNPLIKYVKLKNQFNNEEIKYLKNSPGSQKLWFNFSLFIYKEEWIEKDSRVFYIDPPPKFLSSSDFLIQIRKLKIPLSA